MRRLAFISIYSLFLIAGSVLAQETSDLYNPNSLKQIPTSDIMIKKRVWRRMDLKERQNLPFFAYNNEITKIIIEGVKNGTLYAYTNDSLTTRMTKEKFLENIKLPDMGGDEVSDEEAALGFGEEEGGDDWGSGDEEEEEEEGGSGELEYFLPKDASVLEIMEDWIFDKKRSRLYYDILSIKMVLPPENFPETGLLREVATFKYKDLVSLFRSMPHDAIWYNPQNQSEHKNLADAFELRLFSANIVKVGNPRDEMIIDVFGGDPKQAILQSQKYEYQLMEMEHEVWEY